METAAGRLAVARLTEPSDGAALFRREPDRPLQGYCLVAGDDRCIRVTVYVENGLTHTALLDGELVWLRGRPSPEEMGRTVPIPEPQPSALVPIQAPVAVPAPAVRPLEAVATPWVGLLAGAGATASAGPGAEDGPGAQAGAPASPPAEPAFPPPTSPPETEGLVTEGFKLVPEPATLVSAPARAEHDAAPVAAPASDHATESGPESVADPVSLPADGSPVAVPLAGLHPLAGRAGGSAQLHLADGRVALTLRGMPSPSALGRTGGSSRSWNAYRVWLLNQRTGTRQPLGLCQRVWGENFRFESESGLPLSRFDAVLVTPDDRMAAAADAQAPQVVLGSYQVI